MCLLWLVDPAAVSNAVVEQINGGAWRTRTEMAEEYARLLDEDRVTDYAYLGHVDWAAINAAIMARWSHSGLTYIKNLAWKLRLGVASVSPR
jgi:hypothetical protein